MVRCCSCSVTVIYLYLMLLVLSSVGNKLCMLLLVLLCSNCLERLPHGPERFSCLFVYACLPVGRLPVHTVKKDMIQIFSRNKHLQIYKPKKSYCFPFEECTAVSSLMFCKENTRKKYSFPTKKLYCFHIFTSNCF